MKKIYIGIICTIVMMGLGSVAHAAEGDVWLTPVTQELGASTGFDMEVRIDTGGKNLGAFNMYFDFDPTDMTIDVTQGIDPSSDTGRGFHKGGDTANYMMMSNSEDIANGHFRFAGITASNYANGNNQHIITIHAETTAEFTSGSSSLELRVNELSDELGHALTAGTVTNVVINAPNTNVVINAPNFVYRFWSKNNKSHFYTASEAERDHIIATYDEDTWKYEGIAYKAPDESVDDITPVYRFWSSKHKGHFYTASEAERDHIIATYDENTWKYEGIAYYAYSTEQVNTKPVYRFWSKKHKHHFYTASAAEKDYVIANYDDYIWAYEGIAWYVVK